jgi:hypothetical protein
MHKRNGMNKNSEILTIFRNEKIDGNDVYRKKGNLYEAKSYWV